MLKDKKSLSYFVSGFRCSYFFQTIVKKIELFKLILFNVAIKVLQWLSLDLFAHYYHVLVNIMIMNNFFCKIS